MRDALRFKVGRTMLPIPSFLWRWQVRREARGIGRLLRSFMTPDHHRVRNFVVTALPEHGPLPLATIADATELPLERARVIVDELEEKRFFLFRNPRGDVSWAYPVTCDETPHYLCFESGERMNAA